MGWVAGVALVNAREQAAFAAGIRSEGDEDRNRQLAEHIATGTYRPGWPFIHLRAPRLTKGTARP